MWLRWTSDVFASFGQLLINDLPRQMLECLLGLHAQQFLERRQGLQSALNHLRLIHGPKRPAQHFAIHSPLLGAWDSFAHIIDRTDLFDKRALGRHDYLRLEPNEPEVLMCTCMMHVYKPEDSPEA